MKPKIFKEEIPAGFTKPTSLPQSKKNAKEWQDANYEWWQEHPMRYDWKSNITPREFSKEFFQEIDRRFFEDSKEYLPWNELPFDKIVNFDSLRNKDVLEIGVGNGSHAGLLAPRARAFTGIDITNYAVLSTKKRFRIFGLKGNILKADAEALPFKNESFDLVWSWGVIHHSANTRKVLEEIHRVLRPGGKATIMVYHRGWWNYYMTGFLRGVISGSLFKTHSFHKSIQKHTDGALARYYTPREWKKLVSDLFYIETLSTLGPKSDIILLPNMGLKKFLRGVFSTVLNIFLTRNFRMGVFLVSQLKKRNAF